MAQTEKGIIYPFNYSEIADIPADLKTMAESIDNILSTYSLSTESGNKIVLEMNNSTYKIKAVLKDKNNNTINTSNEIDLPLENMVTNINYNEQKLIITHQNGQQTNVDISDLTDGLVSEEHFDNTLSKLETEINDLKTLVDTELDTNEEEGTEIDVNDSAEYPGKIIPGGDMEQKQLSGKNLLNVGNFSLLKSSNRTLQIAIGTELPVGTYAFSCKLSNGNLSINNGLNIVLKNDQLTNISNTIQTKLNSGNFSGIFTITEIASKIYFYIAQGEDDNATIALSDLQIEQGSITTDFEPYCGGQPSPNPNYPQPIKVVTGDNVIKHCGKNLFYKTENRLWYSGNTKIFNVISESISIADAYIAKVKPNTTYTISKSTTGNRFVIISSTDEPAVGKNYNRTITAQTDTDTTKYTFTTTDSENYIMFGFYRGTDQVAYDNANKDIMIEEGSIATEYEPYREEEYKLDLWKENEFNPNDVNKINATVDLTKITANASGKSFYIECQPNTTYKISRNIVGQRFVAGTTSNVPAIDEPVLDRIVNNAGDEIIITTNSNAHYIVVYYLYNSSENEELILSSIQIQEAIELCKIGDYEDEIFKNVAGDKNYNEELAEGVWYKKKRIDKLILDGTQNPGWTKVADVSGDYVYFYSKFLDTLAINSVELNAVCDKFNVFKGQLAYNTQIDVDTINISSRTATTTNRLRLRILMSRLSDYNVASLNEYLSNNNVTLYYVLAETQYEQITDSTLVSQLEKLRNAKWFKGVNHWWTETENLKPDLKGTYKISNKLKNQNEIANLQAQIDELRTIVAGTDEITVAEGEVE